MRRLSRPPRLATLCVQGNTASSTIDNFARAQLLEEAVRAVQDHNDWPPLDALILPGGFFWISRALGATSFAQRRDTLHRERMASTIQSALRILEVKSPGIRVITGVMARPCDNRERTEQACLAFDASGLIGAARKIFPTKGESRGRRFMTPYGPDFQSEARFVDLPNGSVAALHSCYDLFGTADIGSNGEARRAAIKVIRLERHRIAEADVGFRKLRANQIALWSQAVAKKSPDVLLATIHAFERPGLDGYWQRHGIARASAAHHGALSVGAAHFQEGLPRGGSTLAACAVPKRELTQGVSRRAHSLPPKKIIPVSTADLSGVLRLFEPDRPTGRRNKGGHNDI